MPKLLLTDLSVRTLKSETRRIDYWDIKVPAFGIRVGPRTKTFIAKLGNCRITIGAYPAMSLADARRKALGLKAEGIPTPVSKLTFEAAYERFKAEHIAAKRQATAKTYTRIIERHFLPEFAKTPLRKITYERVTEITDRLRETPSEQAHTLATIRCYLRWCARPPRRYIPHSPLEGLQIKLGNTCRATRTSAHSGPRQRRPKPGGRPRRRPPSSAWITNAFDERRLTACSQACQPRSAWRSRLPPTPGHPALGGEVGRWRRLCSRLNALALQPSGIPRRFRRLKSGNAATPND